MNQLVAAGAAFFLALTLLGLRKRPKNLFSTTYKANLPLQASSLVSSPGGTNKVNRVIDSSSHYSLPKTEQEKIFLRKKLKNLISSGPEERLLAINTAEKWGDLSVLPVLRLGLRDFDSRVVMKSAQAISRFRACPKILQKKKPICHPLNVSRMR